ncbi:MAG: YfhO family protein [Ardenticatenales bacterium]|nr:YfhO family protein [Ardenticatenales bacterium]
MLPDRPTLRKLGADGGVVLLLLLLTVLFFWRLWSPNPAERVAFPVGDFTEQYYPLRRFVAGTLSEGRLPFWNPYIFGGQPGLADPQAAALYPPALLNALLWGASFPLAALQAEAVAHIALALVGTYLFARLALSLERLPALVAAVAFGFGGYMTGFPLEQITILESAAWLPCFLLALHGASPRLGAPLGQRVCGAALAALFLGLALLAGHPQTALYLCYLAAAYALFQITQAPLARSQRLLAGGLLVVPFVLGVGLALMQLLPTTHFISLSTRQSLDYEFVQSGLNWEEMLGLFLPKVVGSTPLYVGIATLLLAPLGLLDKKQQPEKRFWLGVALLSILLSVGGNSALFDLFYLGLPGLGQVRSQERVLLLWSWSLALLAGWGVALLASGDYRVWVRRYVRWLATFAPGFLFIWVVLWWMRGLAFARFEIVLEVFLAFFERYSFFFVLWLLGSGLLAWHAYGSEEPRRPLQPLLFLMLLLLDLFTINRAPHIGGPAEQALAPRDAVVDALYAWQGTAPARVSVVGEPSVRGNDGMRWGFPLLSGNEPLRLADSEAFLQQAPPWRQIQSLAVGYVLADRNLAESDTAAFEHLATASPTSHLLRVRPLMPYGWVVAQTEVVLDKADLYARLQANEFDPYTTALVEKDVPGLAALSQGQVTIEKRAPGWLEARVVMPEAGSGLLLVAETAIEGWHADVDGSPTPWLRANGWNLAIPVEAGEHTVMLRYEQPGWRLGLLLSSISLMIVLAMAVWGGWTWRNSSYG